MPEEDNSLDASGGSKLYDTTSSSLETTAPVVQAIPARRRPSLFKFNRLAFTVTGGTLAAIAIIVGLAFLFNQVQNSKANEIAGKKGSYDVSTISTNGIQQNDSLKVGTADSLDVNGQLQVSNTVVLTPTTAPTTPEAGQIYYDKTLNSLFYYNGSVFVPVANQNSVVSSLGGLTGAINPGAGLSAVGGSLQNTGVLSVQGQTGNVTFTAGGGVEISGTTISTVALPAGQLVLGTGASGFTTVAQASGAGQCLISTLGAPVFGSCTGSTQVTSLNGLINGLTLAPGSGIGITDNGSNIITISSTAAAAITSINGENGPTLTVSNASVTAPDTITINNAAADGATKGIAAFNATNFSASSGVINTIQGISTSASPTFANLTSSGYLKGTELRNATDVVFTLPVTGSGTSRTLCYVDNTSNTNCPTGGDVTYGATHTTNKITALDGSGNLVDSELATLTGGLQYAGSGYLLDLVSGSTSTLTVDNSGAGVANLTVTGKVTATQGLLQGTDTYTLPSNGGNGGVLCYVYSGSSNCPTGGDVSYDTSGGQLHTAGTLAMFTASGVADSVLLQSGGNLSTTGSLTATGGIITNSITSNLAANSPTNDLIITSTNNNIQFSINGGARVFTFDTGGSTQYQTICTTGISCASGGGTAVLLGGSGAQNHVTSDPGIWLNTTVGTGALLRFQVSGSDRFVVNSQGEVNNLRLAGGGTPGTDYVSLNGGTQTGAGTITIPNLTGGSYDLCLSSGNCAGSGGGITGSGSANTIAMFTGSGTIGNSVLSQSGGNLTATGDVIVQGGDVTLGVASSQTGSLSFKHSASAFTGTVIQGSLSGNQTYTLPDSTGDFCLSSGNCIGGGGGGAPNGATYLTTSLDGTLTAERVLTAGTNISVSDGGANSTFTVSVSSTPTFSGLVTANGGLTVEAGDTFTFNGDAFTDLTGTGLQISTGSLQTTLGTSVDLTSEVTGTLAVSNGGIGAATLAVNGILYGNGSSAVQATVAAANSVLVTDGSNVPSLSQTLPTAVQGNITSTGALASGSIASGFGTISTGNNISTTANVQGANVNATTALQVGGVDINTAGTLTNVAYLNAATNNFTGSASIQGASGLNLGGGFGGSQGKLGLYRVSGGYVTLQATDAAGSYTLSIPAITANDSICLVTLANCAGAGASSVGAIDGGTPNSDGATITSNTLYLQYATGLLPGLVSTGTQTLAGAKTLSGAAVFSAAGTGLTVNNNASVLGSGGLTIGVAGATQGKLVLATAGAGSITLQAASIGADYSVSVPNTIAANDTFCLATLANCAGATLQQAYSASVGTTTPEIKLDGTRGAIDIQDADSTIGASLLNIRASNGAGLGTVLASIGNTGNALFQASTNSANAFRVQNAGGTNMLAVDTNGGEVQTTRLAVAVGNATAALDVTQNSTGDIVRFNDGGTQVASIADGGAALFKNSVDSASAFRIQNTAGTTTLLNVDTTNLQTTHTGNTVLNGGVTVAGIGSPGAPGVTNQGSAGSTTYRYAVTARTATGAETALSTVTTTTTGNATLNGSNFNRITWSVVAGAKDYRVYRTASYGTPSTTGLIQTTSALTYDDTGTAASGSLPTADASGNSSVAGTLAVTSAVTSGNALSVSASPVSAIANLITSNAFNVSRSTSSNAAAVVTLDTNASGGTSGATTNNWNHTVNNYSNRLLIVHIAAIQVPPSDPSCSATYAGNAMTLAPGTNPVAVTNNAGTASYRAYTYYLKNPTVGTYSVVVTCSSNTYTRQAWSDSWYNVDQTTPIVAGTPTTAAYAGPTSTTASISVTSTSSDAIVDTMAVTDNSPVTVSAGQTAFTTLTSRDGLYASWKPGSTGASTTMSYTGAGFTTWAYNAYAIKAATAGSTLVTGNAASISSNCSGAANCTDSSNVLNLNQQYASATGAVLQIQNSGVGAGLLVQNGSSTTALAADTVNGSVSVGTANANGVFSAGSSTYSTGTISQTTTTITGVGTTFTQNMSGGTIYYSDGTRSTVTYVSGTSLTSSVSKTVAVGSTYTIVYGGFSVSAGGSTRIQPTTNTTTAFQIQNAAGTSLVTADTTNSKLILGGDMVANAAATATTGTTTGVGGSNTTAVTLSAAGSFANNDVIFVDNTGGSGQDYYTRIVSGGGTVNLVVSPAVSYGTAAGYTGNAAITKYTVQSIGAVSSDYSTLSNRFFQGYFLGGVVTGAGSTTLSDGNLSSTTAMNFNSPSVTFKPTSDSTTAFQIQNNAGTNILAADSTNMRVSVGSRGTATGQLFISGNMPTAALASVGGSNNAWGVAVQGRYAYIGTAATTSGFQVFDISNPASPLQFGSANATSSGKKRVKVQGKYAYVSSAGVSLTGTLEVFDISNPKVPVSVGTQTYTTTGSGNQPALYVQGRYAYVGDGSTRTLWVFDISNPASIPAATQLTNVGGTGSGIADIYAQGRYVYLALSGAASTAQFQIIDMNNPTAPSIAGTVSNTYITGAVTSLAVQGRYAYVGATSGGAGYIYAVDISDPTQASPSVTSMNFGASSAASGLYAQGRTLYVADGTANVIRSADISTPSTPVGISGTSPTTGSAAAQALTGSGRYIYAVTGSSPTNTLQVFDMGGTYSQQIEAGGLETDTLSVRGNANLAGDASIQGSLNVSGQSLINGVLGITQYGATTGINAYSQGQLNVSRNFTATNSVSSIARDTTAGSSCLNHNGQGNGNGSGVVTCSITVASANQVMLVSLLSHSNPSTPTLDGTPMTAITGSGSTSAYAYMYYAINPSVGAHTIATSNGGSYWMVIGSMWSGVDISNGATSAFGTPPTPVYSSGGSTSITATTAYGQVVVDAVRAYGGASAITMAPTGSGTLVNSANYGGSSPYNTMYGGQSYSFATGASTPMTWSITSSSTYAAAAVQLKPASLTGTSYSGSLSSISSNCTVGTNGYCSDSSNILSLNQQFASATGAVLKIQNSSTAPDIQLGNGLIRTTTDSTTAVRIQNAAGTKTALNIDTTNTRVGIGTTAPTATLHVVGQAPTTLSDGSANGTNAADGATIAAAAGGANSWAGYTNNTAGNGGAINLTAGNGGAGAPLSCPYLCSGGYGGNAGSVNITAGTGGTGGFGGGNGGSITLTAGAGVAGAYSTGTNGNINLIASSGGAINIGTSGVASTLQIGNTTGAVAQTINIGNNATASSATTVVIGSTIGTSPVTVQSGTSGALFKGANSTTSFQIQNASSNAIFVADTTNGVIKVALGSTASTNAVCSTLANATGPTANTAYTLVDCNGAPAADYSENYPVASGVTYGDIVATGTNMVNTYDVTDGTIDWSKIKGQVTQLIKTGAPYQANTIGIVSDNYGDFTSAGYNIKEEDNPMPVALNGRVPVNVSPTSGAIQPGDYLTTSGDSGKAMKASGSGYVIGKALSSWTPGSGETQVMVYVEPGYYNGPTITDYLQTGGNGSLASLNVSGAATLGTLTVVGTANFQGNIIVGGHVITAGSTPDTEVLGAAGAGATIAIDGNDTAGTITITTGGGATAGDLGRLIFSNAFGKAPKTILSAQDDASQEAKIFPTGKSATQFILRTSQVLPAGTYTFDYFIVQ